MLITRKKPRLSGLKGWDLRYALRNRCNLNLAQIYRVVKGRPDGGDECSDRPRYNVSQVLVHRAPAIHSRTHSWYRP